MKIFAFAREAGGAEAIVPVIQAAKKNGHEIFLCGKDAALTIYPRYGLKAVFLPSGMNEHVEAVLSRKFFGKMPDLLLTSATSLPRLDMTEKYLWEWARLRGIPSVAVLDQWQNYAERFSGVKKDERLRYLPDVCCVMDEIAKKEMIREGFPENRIRITGQPAFDKIFHSMQEPLPQNFYFPSKKPVVLFLSEALRRHFNSRLGYDEKITLKALIPILKNSNVHLIIKKHPQNIDSDFADLGLETFKSEGIFTMGIAESNVPLFPLIRHSELVIGMSSVALVISILMKRATVSLQIGRRLSAPQPSFPVSIGAIPSLTKKVQAKKSISRLLSETSFRKTWLSRQLKIRHRPGAAERVLKWVEKKSSSKSNLKRVTA